MDRKTKIICTIGPASDNEETLKKLVSNGMNVARLNFSHGSHESHGQVIKTLKRVREELNVPLPIMLDTKGPEYRTGVFENGKAELTEGQTFVFTSENVVGNENQVSVSYKNLPNELSKGDVILVNNGLLSFEVTGIDGNRINCRVTTGGTISDKKSMAFPGKVLKQEFLSQQDISDLLFGIKNDVDFVACSFVSNKENVEKVRSFLDENGGKDIQLIAKIENRAGVDNAEEILDICEGLMVARGDLGVEIPYAELPAIQKDLIKLCMKKGAFCITATEMLESMIEKPRPTRAEISDVANAVFDGSSAVMLSGESASGKYPVEATLAMSKICEDAEKHIDYAKRFAARQFETDNLTDALSHSAGQLALDTSAKCIVSSTMGGMTARMVSRCRLPMPILGFTCLEKTYRQMDAYWGVTPILVHSFTGLDELLKEARLQTKVNGYAKAGDVVVVTGGIRNKAGGTRLIHADIVE